jgi:hypothetical protein
MELNKRIINIMKKTNNLTTSQIHFKINNIPLARIRNNLKTLEKANVVFCSEVYDNNIKELKWRLKDG